MNKFTEEDLRIIYLVFKEAELALDFPDDCKQVMNKVRENLENYGDYECSHHELIRLKLLSEKEYDFCETCFYVRRMR